LKEFLVLARTKSFSTKTLTSHSAVHTYAVVIGERKGWMDPMEHE
jgi:hypothetical protein